MILTSRVSNIFSAGLDITEMHDPDVVRLRSFWTALQNLWMTLYGTPLATVASIEGHAPAGGCLLAMSCDYRVMSTEKAFKMGLNEVALGIVAPFWFAETMSGYVQAFQRRERFFYSHTHTMLPRNTFALSHSICANANTPPHARAGRSDNAGRSWR